VLHVCLCVCLCVFRHIARVTPGPLGRTCSGLAIAAWRLVLALGGGYMGLGLDNKYFLVQSVAATPLAGCFKKAPRLLGRRFLGCMV
jgi:hypothetical protein